MLRAKAMIALAVCVTFGCSSQSPSEVRAGDVYDAAVRWLASEHSDDPDPLPVFVEPRGEGTAIKLEVQADVVDQVSDVAELRFIDARAEAIVTEDDRDMVRDDGILIRLGPVIEDGDRVRLEVDRWIGDERFTTLVFTLRREGDVWKPISAPVVSGVVEVPE